MRFPLRIALLATLAAACADPAAPPDGPEAALSLQIVSGNDQSALAYTELPAPVLVRLLNAKGRPVKGQVVNFRVVQGGGSVWAGASVTDAEGLAKDWWTLGGTFGRSLLEARAVDPATGEQLVLGTLLATPQALITPRVQFKCGNQPDWEPPQTGPVAGECYGTGPEPPSYPFGATIAVRVRVVHNGTVPVARMFLDLYAVHNSATGTAPVVTPLYAKTDANGEVALTMTLGDRQVLNALLVVGPDGSGVNGEQDFKNGY